jgi:hypothetical protein
VLAAKVRQQQEPAALALRYEQQHAQLQQLLHDLAQVRQHDIAALEQRHIMELRILAAVQQQQQQQQEQLPILPYQLLRPAALLLPSVASPEPAIPGSAPGSAGWGHIGDQTDQTVPLALQNVFETSGYTQVSDGTVCILIIVLFNVQYSAVATQL